MTPVLARRQDPDGGFERVYRRHAGDVYRYALVVLRNQADAEDVTQTTFMNAFRAMENGERPVSVEERRLGDVLGVGRVAKHGQRVAVDVLGVGAVEPLERAVSG